MGTDESQQLLGLNRNASREVLKREFRRRLLNVHPDLNPNDSLATERTRRLIEVYHALCKCLDSGRMDGKSYRCSVWSDLPSSKNCWVKAANIVMPDRILKTVALIALLAVMAWVVLNTVGAVFGGAWHAFRPDPVGIPKDFQTRVVATISEPSINECLEWYWARQYRLSFAADWAAREAVRIFKSAAREAHLQNQVARARFYESTIDSIVRARCGKIM